MVDSSWMIPAARPMLKLVLIKGRVRVAVENDEQRMFRNEV